jgi:hypothetical protein
VDRDFARTLRARRVVLVGAAHLVQTLQIQPIASVWSSRMQHHLIHIQ